MDSLNTVWSGLASKMYDTAGQDPSQPGPETSSNEDSAKKDKKKEGEIEHADFEVVD